MTWRLPCHIFYVIGKCSSKFGCGEGRNSIYLAKNNVETEACDLSEIAIENAKRNAGENNAEKVVFKAENIFALDRQAKFGTLVESCSKKVAVSSVLASVNTFSAASGNFFYPPLHGIILAISENAKNGRKVLRIRYPVVLRQG